MRVAAGPAARIEPSRRVQHRCRRAGADRGFARGHGQGRTRPRSLQPGAARRIEHLSRTPFGHSSRGHGRDRPLNGPIPSARPASSAGELRWISIRALVQRPARRIGSNALSTRVPSAMLRSTFQPIGLLLILQLVALPGCGGGSTRGADSPGESGSEEGYEGYGAGDSLPECEDGTCFACGDTYCPNGFYCDDGAPGGPGCSWLPECADAVTCSCVKDALGEDCTCEERDGGIHVTCD